MGKKAVTLYRLNNAHGPIYEKTGPTEFRETTIVETVFTVKDGEVATTFITKDGHEIQKAYWNNNGTMMIRGAECRVGFCDTKKGCWNVGDNYISVKDDAFIINAYDLDGVGESREISFCRLHIRDNEARIDISDILGPDLCMFSPEDDCYKVNSKVKVLDKADNVVMEKKPVIERIALSDEEKTFIKGKLEEITNFCKDHGIKLGYNADNCDLVAGHVDDISYDDFNSEEDSHFDIRFMDSFNVPFLYANDEYEFVLRGDKKKED
ncbi:MAG: hypothetical protein HUK20_06040 [Fibrobacter sp.]|nr:hypothetical protein [Fibrobacter sp.]